MRDNRHVNLPIFIPHLGCPHRCVFCNQRSISGHATFDPRTVEGEIETALRTIQPGTETEIAFFGGSFTGLERPLMCYLLDTAERYVKEGRVAGIRLSTRPDYIDDEILTCLRQYSVRTVELGMQSLTDRVLAAAKRGHDALCAERAGRLVKQYGFSLVGQMMIGLPLATPADETDTARRICAMGADAARVYPTVVFYGTELCRMAQRGEYRPLTNEEAVLRTKDVLKILDAAGVPCLRVGLCASESLASPEAVYGGANHSAIGEMAMGEVFFDRMCEALDRCGEEMRGADVVIYVPKKALSQAIGQKKRNVIRIKDKYFVKFAPKSVRILALDSLMGYNIKIDILGNGGTHACT